MDIDEVIDIIVKRNRALVVLEELNKRLMERVMRELRREFSVDRFEFVDPTRFLRERDLLKEFFDGFSIINKMNLFEELGLKKYVRYNYSLENLDPCKKALFSYELIGRRQQPGILQKLGGIYIGRGVVAVPDQHKRALEELFRKWNVHFKKTIFYRW